MKQFLKDNNGLLQAFNPRIPVYQSYTWTSGVSPAGEVYIIEDIGLFFENIKIVAGGTIEPNIGEIKHYYGTTAPNSDWLICDGSTFDATVYPQLATLLGGNTLPDCRQSVFAASDNVDVGNQVGAGFKSHTHSISTSHTHSVGIANHTHTVASWISFSWAGTSGSLSTGSLKSANTSTSTETGTSGSSDDPITFTNDALDANDVSLEDITRAHQIGVNVIIRGK